MTEQSKSVLIRRGKLEDAQFIADFNCAMALETEQLSLSPDTVLSGVQAVMTDPSHGFYLVGEFDGAVIGCLMVTYEWSDWRNGRIWWIQSVYVKPDHRGKGVYKSLYQSVLSGARKEPGGIRAVRLYVEKENFRAQSVYEKLGMHNSGYLVYETEMIGD